MFEPNKICVQCGGSFYEHDYPIINSGKGFSISRKCRSCFQAMKRESENKSDARRAHRCANRHIAVIQAIRARCRKSGHAYDLDDYREEIKVRFQNGLCELTGIAFDTEAGERAQWNSASIDRVKPQLGYVYSNIRVICWGLNMAFSHWGEDQTAVLMQAWLDKRKQK